MKWRRTILVLVVLPAFGAGAKNIDIIQSDVFKSLRHNIKPTSLTFELFNPNIFHRREEYGIMGNILGFNSPCTFNREYVRRQTSPHLPAQQSQAIYTFVQNPKKTPALPIISIDGMKVPYDSVRAIHRIVTDVDETYNTTSHVLCSNYYLSNSTNKKQHEWHIGESAARIFTQSIPPLDYEVAVEIDNYDISACHVDVRP